MQKIASETTQTACLLAQHSCSSTYLIVVRHIYHLKTHFLFYIELVYNQPSIEIVYL